MPSVNSSPSASSISSRHGQIVASGWPPGLSSGSNPHPDDPPSPLPGILGSENLNFGGPMPKRGRMESGGGIADLPMGCGKDMISDLPDVVLLSVLSYLPLRDAGRTTILSTRWRGLFDQSLLDFNACQPFPPEEGRGCEWMIGAVNSILATRPHMHIRRFHLVMYGRGFVGRLHVVDRWFRDLARRGVRDLNIDMFYTIPKPNLPRSLLGFASLEILKVYCCIFPDIEPPPQLPVLRTLILSNVTISQHSLHAMLWHCTSLECVKLKNIVGVEKLCLRSKSLARLYGDFGDFTELIIEEAPNLEELVGIDLPNANISLQIAFAPKLQLLGNLWFNYITFVEGNMQLKPLICSVKTLSIQVPFSTKGYSGFVAQLLKCFPCLQVLHLEPGDWSISQSVDVEEWDTTHQIQCVENSINKVVFNDFGGEKGQWGFLTFLLEMARDLKIVEFYCWEGKEWASKQVKLIAPINRASPDVDFLFFKICKPMRDLYLCHCCPGRCQKESRIVLIEELKS